MLRKNNKIIGIALLIGALLAPINAYAWGDAWYLVPKQLANAMAWAQAHAEKLQQMASDKMEKLASLAQLEVSTLFSLEGTATAVSSTVEKQTAAEHQLAQSEMNYKAAKITAAAAADAEHKFSSNLGVASMCAVTGTTEKMGRAAHASNITGKALASSLVNRDMSTVEPGVAKEELARNHAKNYCSDKDKEHGRCLVEAAPTEQNADLQLSTLMLPSNGTTYTDKESLAAVDFVRMVASISALPKAPVALERTAEGRSYLLATRVGAAQMSVVYNTFSQLWAMRTPMPLNDAEEGEASGALSMLGLMKKLVDDTFVNPAWKTNLVAMTPNETLREIAVIMAGKNYTTFQAYQQRQRLEALYATKLSIESVSSNEARLAEIKSKIR